MSAKGVAMANNGGSYVDQLRELVGNRRLIIPAIRAIIQDSRGEFLFIQRRDNGRWALPSGCLEIGESVRDCLVREMKEETGLDVISATPIAIHSEPRFGFTDETGAGYQLVIIVFWVDHWKGELVTHTDETIDAGFFSREGLPEVLPHYLEALEDFGEFRGKLILK
jgi:ADP-ribose pyrophosphatase YjhB (NUDIX family)